MTKDARFYFLNLASDVMRCISAGERGDEPRYRDSLLRATQTLSFLKTQPDRMGYEEGMLLLSALRLAKEDNRLNILSTELETVCT